VVRDEPEQQRQHDASRDEAVNAEGDGTDLLPRQRGRVPGRNLHRYLAARVADPHHQHIALSQLRWIAILRRVQLDDARIELSGKRGNPRHLVAAHGHDDVVRLKSHGACGQLESVAAPSQAVDAESGPNGQLEPGGIRLEVVGHLILGGE
jgi:hypothetical protein